MTVNVPKEVISDLWALQQAGLASRESQMLVTNYLAGDPAHRDVLMNTRPLPALVAPVQPTPDEDRRILDAAAAGIRATTIRIGLGVAAGVLLILALGAGGLYLVLTRR